MIVTGGYPFERGDRLYTSESDIQKRQILTSKDGPALQESKKYITAVDP